MSPQCTTFPQTLATCRLLTVYLSHELQLFRLFPALALRCTPTVLLWILRVQWYFQSIFSLGAGALRKSNVTGWSRTSCTGRGDRFLLDHWTPCSNRFIQGFPCPFLQLLGLLTLYQLRGFQATCSIVQSIFKASNLLLTNPSLHSPHPPAEASR